MLAVIGLGTIHVSSQKVIPAEPDISEIDSSMSGETVQISGEVVSSSLVEETLFLDVGGETNITVVSFDTSERFEEGEEVSITGTVRIYRGEMEVVADSIRRT